MFFNNFKYNTMKKIVLSILLMLFAIAGPTMANDNPNTVIQPDLNSVRMEIPFEFSSQTDYGCTVDEEYGVRCIAVGEMVAIWFKENTEASRKERREFAREAREVCNMLQDMGLVFQN
jgi:hypothetical protein